jgi:hypothetical protein
MTGWRFAHFDELTAREVHDILQARSAVFVIEQACLFQDRQHSDVGPAPCCTSAKRNPDLRVCDESRNRVNRTQESRWKSPTCATTLFRFLCLPDELGVPGQVRQCGSLARLDDKVFRTGVGRALVASPQQITPTVGERRNLLTDCRGVWRQGVKHDV